ncbi:MAG: GNAT family N-acetyltransferase [Solirubrobacterales bacterium]
MTPRGWPQPMAKVRGPSAAIFVAEHRSEPLGLCIAHLDMDSVRCGRRCWVEDLAVSPKNRSQGVGKASLDAAKDWARQRAPTHLGGALNPGHQSRGSRLPRAVTIYRVRA